MTPNVPMSDTGTATVGMSAARGVRRKANTTSVTRITEMISDISTSCSEARMVGVRSRTTALLIAAGNEAWTCGNAARTLSTVAMTFAPGLRKTTTSTAGWPLESPPARRSSTESRTSATSESCSGAPFSQATTMGRYCSALCSWSLVSI